MKRTIIAIIAGLSFVGGAQAQTSTWMRIGETTEAIYSLNTGAYEFSSLMNGKRIFGTVVKQYNKNSGINSFIKEYVLEEDCRKGYGMMNAYDLRDNFMQNVDWAKGSGTVSANIAQALCFEAGWR